MSALFSYQPKDSWQAKMDECSKSGLIYLVDLLAFINQVPREQMLSYAVEALEFGKRDAFIRRLKLRQTDPDLSEIRRLEKMARALKAKRKRKEKV